MAADYIEAMRRVQPAGPYAIGGFCMGATVALEMARTVAAGGRRPALVLVDPRLPRPWGFRYDLWVARRRFQAGALRRSLRGWLGRRGAPRDPGECRPHGHRAGDRPCARGSPATALHRSGVADSERGARAVRHPSLAPAWAVPNARTVPLALGHTPMLRVPGVRLLAGAMRDALRATGPSRSDEHRPPGRRVGLHGAGRGLGRSSAPSSIRTRAATGWRCDTR